VGNDGITHLSVRLARSVIVLLALVRLAGATEGHISAKRYDVTLAPDAAHGTFTGSERIELELDRRISELRLDALGLDLLQVAASVGGHAIASTIHDSEGSLLVRFARPAPAGPLLLDLRWTGHLSGDLRGIYSTKASGQSQVFTQLAPRAARRVFPCLDEPGQRARFVIHAIVEPDQQAISNGAVASEDIDTTLLQKTITFRETAPIPAYLVSLAVGRFDILEDLSGRTPIRVVASEGSRGRATAALRVAAELLPKFEAYLGVPYPFGKLDIVAVPELAPHAMENAGAIFVRADELLIDEAHATSEAQLQLMRRLAHELAHHWFGDLVTMATWHDLWLSEALARWTEFELIDQLRPELRMWDRFHALRDSALERDSQSGAHPIRTVRASRDPAFDPITYNKGAATLRMIQRWIGADAFRAALHDYLASHVFAAASGEDFWKALGSRSSAEVEQLAKAWFESPGHPTLDLDADCTSGALDIHISQHAERWSGGRPWSVPLILRTGTTTLRLVVRHPHVEVRLREPGGCPTQLQPDSPGELPYQLVLAHLNPPREGDPGKHHTAMVTNHPHRRVRSDGLLELKPAP
jgi:puromycin-sensitive aminopeptidase